MPQITIDGHSVGFEPGQTILEVAAAEKIRIPTLCYLPEAGHRDVCRICVVEVEGLRRLLPACSTPATEGMVIGTRSERVMASRRATISLLLGSGRHTCITCESLGECQLSELAYDYKVEAPTEPVTGEFPRLEDGHIIRDYSKCILCGRCWAACTAIQVWGILPHPSGRRDDSAGGSDWYPLPDLERCETCGQCVDACPVGALTEKRVRGVARSWELQRLQTVCPHCGMGCQTMVHTKDGEVVKVTGVQDALPNLGRLCRRGRFAFSDEEGRERLTSPLVRRDGVLQRATWGEALDAVAARVAAIVERDGPDAVAGLFAPSLTNEDAYLAQKLFREAIGTNNVDHRSRVASLLPSLQLRAREDRGEGGALAAIEHARVILLAGDGAVDDYPVAAAALRRAVRDGARLIVVDSGDNGLAELATLRVGVAPRHLRGVLDAITGALLGLKYAQRTAAGDDVHGLDALQSLLADAAPEHIAEISHVAADTIRGIARDLADEPTAVVCAALGPEDDVSGASVAVVRLQALLDELGDVRGIQLPRGAGNSQGLADMGVVPDALAGCGPVASDACRLRYAEGWKALPEHHGLSTAGVIDALPPGRLMALWLCADETSVFDPDGSALRDGLAAAEFVVAQVTALGDVAAAADVVLPRTSFGEDEGTFINVERRISRLRTVATPPGEARPPWWVYREVARRLGHVWGPDSPRAIWDDEISRLAPGLAEITYEALERRGICWFSPEGGGRTVEIGAGAEG